MADTRRHLVFGVAHFICVVFGLAIPGPLACSTIGAECSFRVICVDDTSPQGLLYPKEPNALLLPVRFEPNHWSASYPYRGPQTLEFFRASSPDSGTAPGSVARAAVPPAVSRLTLLFQRSHRASDRENYSIFVLNEAPTTFPIRSVCVVNLSTSPLLVRVGANDREIGFPASHVFTYGPRSGGRISLGVAVMIETEWRVLVDHELSFQDDYRYLIVILPPTENDSLRIRLKMFGEPVTKLQ